MPPPFDEPGDTLGASLSLDLGDDVKHENEKEKQEEMRLEGMSFDQFVTFIQHPPGAVPRPEERRTIEINIPQDEEQKTKLGRIMREYPELFIRPRETGHERPPFVLTTSNTKTKNEDKDEKKITPTKSFSSKRVNVHEEHGIHTFCLSPSCGCADEEENNSISPPEPSENHDLFPDVEVPSISSSIVLQDITGRRIEVKSEKHSKEEMEKEIQKINESVRPPPEYRLLFTGEADYLKAEKDYQLQEEREDAEEEERKENQLADLTEKYVITFCQSLGKKNLDAANSEITTTSVKAFLRFILRNHDNDYSPFSPTYIKETERIKQWFKIPPWDSVRYEGGCLDENGKEILRCTEEIEKFLKSGANPEGPKLIFIKSFVLFLTQHFEIKEQETDERCQKNIIDQEQLFKDDGPLERKIRIALTENSLRGHNIRFRKTLQSKISELEKDFEKMNYFELTMKGEEIMDFLNDKHFINTNDQNQLMRCIFQTVLGSIRIISDFPPAPDVPIYGKWPENTKALGTLQDVTVSLDKPAWPVQYEVTTVENTQEDLKKIYEEFEEEKKMKTEEVTIEENTETCFCGALKDNHPSPLCSTDTCYAPMYFQHELMTNDPPSMRRVCLFCNKRHLKVIIKTYLTIEGNKITDISTQTKIEERKPWSDVPPIVTVKCEGFSCPNTLLTQTGMIHRKRGQPSASKLCQACLDKYEPPSKTPEVAIPFNNLSWGEIYQHSESVCFIPPPFGIHYDHKGARKKEFGVYLPEDQIRTGFQVPDWSQEKPELRPALFPYRGLDEKRLDEKKSELYRDISKYYFLSRCVRNKKCVYKPANKLELTPFCTIHDHVNHAEGRLDSEADKKQRDTYLYHSETSNLKHFSYFIEPPAQSDYTGYSRNEDSVLYHPRVRINYEGMPTSRNELVTMGYSVNLLPASLAQTDQNRDIESYIKKYLQMEILYSGNNDIWIENTDKSNYSRQIGAEFSPRIESKFQLCHQNLKVSHIESEIYERANPPDGILRDSDKNILPSSAEDYWNDDFKCYVPPPFLIHYDEKGNRKEKDYGRYKPEDHIQGSHFPPKWEIENKNQKPVFSLPSYTTRIGQDSDLYKDISRYHLVSRCVLKKTCTKIRATEEGRNFKITLAPRCQHGFPLKADVCSKWSDQQTQDQILAHSENHNLFLFSVILYPPYLPHYTDEGVRMYKDFGDYRPLSEINYACDDDSNIGLQEKNFLVTLPDHLQNTQADRDLTAYQSMKIHMDSFLSNKRDKFHLEIKQPSPRDYGLSGSRLNSSFSIHIMHRGSILNNLQNIDPYHLFSNECVSHLSKDDYRIARRNPNPLIKGYHPNKNKGYGTSLFEKLMGQDKIVVWRSGLQTLGAKTKEEKKWEKYEHLKTSLSIFGSFIPPPISYTYNDKGELKNGYQAYEPVIRINYWSINANQINTVSFKGDPNIPADSEMANDVEKYTKAVLSFLKHGSEVIPPEPIKNLKQGWRAIGKINEKDYKCELREIQHIGECYHLRKSTTDTEEVTLGVLHPNRTFEPNHVIDFLNQDHVNLVKIKRPDLYILKTDIQRDQDLYTRAVRDLSIFGSYVEPPWKYNYGHKSKRIKPYLPEILINQFFVHPVYMENTFYMKPEDDPDRYTNECCVIDLQQDIRIYQNLVQHLFTLGAQIIPPITCNTDSNGIPPLYHNSMKTLPIGYRPFLTLRPSLEFEDKGKDRVLRFDTLFDPWDLSLNPVDTSKVKRLYKRACALSYQQYHSKATSSSRVPNIHGFDIRPLNMEEYLHPDDQQVMEVCALSSQHSEDDDESEETLTNESEVSVKQKGSNGVFITSNHPNKTWKLKNLDDLSIITQRKKIDDFSGQPLAPCDNPKQRYIEKYIENLRDLSIFGALVLPPRRSIYNRKGELTGPPYIAPIVINRKALRRYDMGCVYHFPESFEESLYRKNEHPQLLKDYETYVTKVEQIRQWGCEVVHPDKAMNIESRETRETANWDQLEIMIRPRSEDYLAVKSDPEENKRFINIFSKIQPADFSVYSPHPNLLIQHKITSRNEPEVATNISKSDEYFVNRFIIERDLSLFGSFIDHPRYDMTPLQVNHKFKKEINYKCLREDSNTMGVFRRPNQIGRRPENQHLDRIFWNYNTEVEKLVQYGSAPSPMEDQVLCTLRISRERIKN